MGRRQEGQWSPSMILTSSVVSWWQFGHSQVLVVLVMFSLRGTWGILGAWVWGFEGCGAGNLWCQASCRLGGEALVVCAVHQGHFDSIDTIGIFARG